ncbi:sulfite exporter TauE/SafE family protein [Staphylococcus capitis]|uniref:sulfite exporter TauE/SafE family protein n=1 Tax=Staphylococcus capitis TaxID=29388 RepID=UPI00188535F2|nr:TSUP family transporter [Staphylococcus capitis]QOX60532.1 TSUP family transporter [Staphylococcus capitis]
MDWHLSVIVTIMFFGFIASFIDSVVGGGGLVSTPALLAVGLPPSMALGTNKFASSFSTLTSAFKFIRSGKVDLKVVGKLFPFVFIASGAGAILATYLPANILKPLIIVVLTIVIVYTIVKKDWGSVRSFTSFTFIKAFIFSIMFIILGFYDGFLGGGTGSFMLFTLLMFGFDFLSAAGNAKVLNFASNIGGLLLFIMLGQVNFTYGFIMALRMIVGSYFGAHFALKKGVGYVKNLFILVTAVLILKNIYDYVMQLMH